MAHHPPIEIHVINSKDGSKWRAITYYYVELDELGEPAAVEIADVEGQTFGAAVERAVKCTPLDRWGASPA